jgi:hypothetical protein
MQNEQLSKVEKAEKPLNAFEKAAAEQQGGNVLSDCLGLVHHNKKWWLLPILVALLLFGLLIVLAGTAAAPFIYTLF